MHVKETTPEKTLYLMPTNKNASIRYQTLDKCFRDFSHRYYIDDLIASCNEALMHYNDTGGVSRRQIFDDIKYMESEEGWSIPLERRKIGRKVFYRYESQDFSINNQPVTKAEANQLKLAIAEAKIVDTSRLSTDSVQILSKVEMTNLANKAKMTYTIVSESEANLQEGKISITTPIAQGLLNHKVGDEVEIKIPRGTIKLRIDKITVG